MNQDHALFDRSLSRSEQGWLDDGIAQFFETIKDNNIDSAGTQVVFVPVHGKVPSQADLEALKLAADLCRKVLVLYSWFFLD
jgi:hypothetical protein